MIMEEKKVDVTLKDRRSVYGNLRTPPLSEYIWFLYSLSF